MTTPASTGVDWPALHQRVIEGFSAGWAAPGPHAWDELLDENVELNQPLLPPMRGRALWWEETRRLLMLVPDLRGTVFNWAAREDVLFVEFELAGTVGGGRLAFPATDVLWLTEAGTLRRRDSYFDPTGVARFLLRRPSAWPAWWRSGVGPLLARRRLLH